MTTKRIVYKRPDGGVSVVCPAPNARNSGESETDFVARISAKVVPIDAANIEVMEASTLPGREFRNAWEKPGAGIAVSMPKARDIHAEHMGRAHAAEISRLKVEERSERLKGNTTQADAHAATVTALEALDLNVLATQIAAVPNPAALSAIWPAQVPR